MARRRSRAGGEELRKHALCPRRNFHVVCLRKVHERFLDVITNLSTLARLAIDVFATFDLFGDDGRSTGAAGVEGDTLDLSKNLGGDRPTALAAVAQLAVGLTSLK